jgi:hypothetical protein
MIKRLNNMLLINFEEILAIIGLAFPQIEPASSTRFERSAPSQVLLGPYINPIIGQPKMRRSGLVCALLQNA